jgi:hypothetical protein
MQAFIAAVRASQTATEMLDSSVADYLGIDRSAYRALDILDQEGPLSAGQLAERARLSRRRSPPCSTVSRRRGWRNGPATLLPTCNRRRCCPGL